jgi:hypothetical protein
MAFTYPGWQVICVADNSDRDPDAATIIVIHEFLHTLGLGENPPTSEAITEQVTLRCSH